MISRIQKIYSLRPKLTNVYLYRFLYKSMSVTSGRREYVFPQKFNEHKLTCRIIQRCKKVKLVKEPSTSREAESMYLK